MTWVERVRAIAGLLVVATLLGMLVVELLTGRGIPAGRIELLLGLIAALLGIDIASKTISLPVQITIRDANNRENGEEQNK